MNSVQTLEHETASLQMLDIEAELTQVDTMLREAATLSFPLLNALLTPIIAAGGKRLRPMMTLLSARVPGKTEDQIEKSKLFQVAAAVEMLHTASLVHDDTIDEANLRRGAATLNSSLKGGTVILIGDYLFAQSAILITRPGNPRVVKIFAECLATICDGELTQLFSKRQWKQSREDYYKRIYCKTAVLFATACELGSIIGGGDDDLTAKMRRFGHLLGMGFQIIDDVIDFKPASVTGKMTGGDLRQGIVTLPTMYFFERANPADATYVKGVVENSEATDNEIERAVSLIGASGAFETAFDEAKDFILRAKEVLDTVPDSESKSRLLQIADYALQREK